MKDKIANSIAIKEKAEFIYLNSGIILSKLDDEFLRVDVENNLQMILFFDTPLNELTENTFSLLNRTCPVIYPSNYESSIKIIFHMAYLIDNENFLEDGKERLRNQLRLYTKYFPYEEKDLIRNKQYVRFHEKN